MLRIHGHKVRLQLLSFENVDNLQFKLQSQHFGQQENATARGTRGQIVKNRRGHLATADKKAVDKLGYNLFGLIHQIQLKSRSLTNKPAPKEGTLKYEKSMHRFYMIYSR